MVLGGVSNEELDMGNSEICGKKGIIKTCQRDARISTNPPAVTACAISHHNKKNEICTVFSYFIFNKDCTDTNGL